MLQTIRDKFTGWIAIVFIGLISMTLVISFGNMDQTPLQDDVVITVNGEEITLFGGFGRVFKPSWLNFKIFSETKYLKCLSNPLKNQQQKI